MWLRVSLWRLVVVGAIGVVGVLCMGACADAAVPWWHVSTFSAPPATGSKEGEVVFYAANLGDAPASDEAHPLMIRDVLPAGVQVTEAHAEGGGGPRGINDQSNRASCSRAGQEVTCTYPLPVLPYEGVIVVVDVRVVAPGADVGVNEATVSGGLLASSTQRQALALEGTPSYGAAHLALTPEEADGTPALRAGSHPFQLTSTVTLNTQAVPVVGGLGEHLLELRPLGLTKDLRFNVPPGLVVNATALPKCPDSVFTEEVAGGEEPTAKCPDDTIVGVAESIVAYDKPLSPLVLAEPMYNLEPAYGEPARFGFSAQNVPVTLDTAVDVTGGDTGATVIVPDITQESAFIGAQTTFWGWPADPRHDSQRGECLLAGEPKGSCPLLERPPKPFLLMPTSCAGPLATNVEADSWEHAGEFTQFFAEPIPMLRACNQVPFAPTLAAEASTNQASSSSGLDLKIAFNDEGLGNPEGVAESQLNKTVVMLPEGMTVNPSAGVGLSGCTPADFARESVSSAAGEGCPNSSKLGTVTIESPLISSVIHGNVYIAQPYENPFGSLLGLYIVAKDPERGILVKLTGRVVPNEETGRLTTIFEDVPQLPFDHFDFHFREGQQAPLITPPVCGSYNTEAQLTPWSAPEGHVTDSAPFQVTSGFGGGACPAGGTPPFSPTVIAGTNNNVAGSYSPFYLRITREENEQELTRFSTIMPPGLTGNLTGIPFCPDAAIEAARGMSGAQELAEPSCPPASEIGHTIVGAGAGTVLATTPGKLYLAGPYHGASFSIVSITSAVVGPFDLGTVVIRFALRINPITAQAEIDATGSDPIPHIIKGIVVHVRDIHVYVDGGQRNSNHFIINPTSCAPMQIANAIDGTDPSHLGSQTTVTVDTRYQAADCANLAFKPGFSVSTSGKTSKANGASLTAKLTYPNAPQGTQANIASVKVDLPKQLPSRLTTLQKACTAAQFSTNPAGCPAASFIGHAKAITPILPVPLEGPAIFVSHGGEAFPSLEIVLQGYGVTIDLVGSTFISKSGITSSTFKTVPDEPVGSFELTLPEGPYSALTAVGNLCTAKKLTMPTEFIAQNGASIHQSTKIAVTGCPKHKTKAKRAPRKRKKAKKTEKQGKSRKLGTNRKP